jgi:hypothetical protein
MQFKHSFGLGLVSLLVIVALSTMVLPVVLADQTGNNATKGKLLYLENFSSSKGSSWGGDLSANFSYYFENGKYHLNVDQYNSYRAVSFGQNYNNSILEVEATQEAGPNDNICGVIVRKADWNNYYLFAISGDGYYCMAKLQNNTWSPTSWIWKKSGAIHTGNATNLISVVSDGDNFSLYVNNIGVDNYTDGSFPSGMIGLAAGTLYTPGAAEIGFDNLKVWEIKR